MIEVPERGDEFHSMWVDLIRLNERPAAPWTLIGAHMAALHGWAKGREPIRPSRDADILVNARAVADGTARFSRQLEREGYRMDPPSPEGTGHLFVKGSLKIDVLAPDGIGARASRRTLGSAYTVMVPGGTQALQRTVPFEVRTRSIYGLVPTPTLLGAILVKARAVEVSDSPAAQLRDLAFLLTLVDDPDELGREATTAERRWLRRRRRLADPTDPAWIGVEDAEAGQIVFQRLTSFRR